MTDSVIGTRVYNSNFGRGTIVGYRSSDQVRAANGYRGHPSPRYRIKFDSGTTREMVSAKFVRCAS